MLATLTNISLDAAEDNTWKYVNISWYTNVFCVDDFNWNSHKFWKSKAVEKARLFYLPLFPVYFLMTSHMTLELGVFDCVHRPPRRRAALPVLCLPAPKLYLLYYRYLYLYEIFLNGDINHLKWVIVMLPPNVNRRCFISLNHRVHSAHKS